MIPEEEFEKLGAENVATLTYKLQCIAIIFFTALIGGIIPLRRTASPKFLSLGNCFSGGIFLSAGFIHMLTEAIEGFESLQWETSFPVIMFFTVIGILVPFFIERVILDHHSHADVIVQRPARTLDSSGGASDVISANSQVNIYVLWLMLGVHSIIEGMALGVERHRDDVLYIEFLYPLNPASNAIAPKAFALGISLVKAGIPSKRTIQLVASFACSVPVGIILGILLSSSVDGFFNSVITEIMKAIAAGTFIYVALIEIILEEFSSGHEHDHRDEEKPHHHRESKASDKYAKFFAILVGVFIMSTFNVYHEHGH